MLFIKKKKNIEFGIGLSKIQLMVIHKKLGKTLSAKNKFVLTFFLGRGGGRVEQKERILCQ